MQLSQTKKINGNIYHHIYIRIQIHAYMYMNIMMHRCICIYTYIHIGGNTGIGYATAREFALRGASVIIGII
jgi:hypothetical protein